MAMNERTWERWGALSGLVFAVLLVVRTLMTPKIPFTEGPDGVAGWFSDNQRIWTITVWLTGLIILLGTWFIGGLRAYLARQGASRLGTIALTGWAIVAAIALMRHAMLAVPAMYPVGFEITGLLAGMASLMLGMVWFAALITTLAVAMAGLETKKLPSWFTWLSFLESFILLVGTLQLVQADGPFSTSGILRWVVLYSYIAWNAIGSLLLYSLLKKE